MDGHLGRGVCLERAGLEKRKDAFRIMRRNGETDRAQMCPASVVSTWIWVRNRDLGLSLPASSVGPVHKKRGHKQGSECHKNTKA